jgi:hypothetical protein
MVDTCAVVATRESSVRDTIGPSLDADYWQRGEPVTATSARLVVWMRRSLRDVALGRRLGTSGYHAVQLHIASGRLRLVPGAPRFSYPV